MVTGQDTHVTDTMDIIRQGEKDKHLNASKK
jgi:hypothetical protein